MNPVRLILASASPRRKTLLEQIGLTFDVHPSHVAEPPFSSNDPVKYASDLAHLKAASIAEEYPDDLVLGADTIVVIDNQVLGKPHDDEDAGRMLQTLSGRTHEVITAYSLHLKNMGIVETRHVSTGVHFRQIPQDEMDIYIGSGDPLDKAGAYGIQDYSGIFVDRIEGCFYNVVGFPLSDFNVTLKTLLAQKELKLH